MPEPPGLVVKKGTKRLFVFERPGPSSSTVSSKAGGIEPGRRAHATFTPPAVSVAASMAFFTPPGIVNLVKEGKLRALAVTTATRSTDLPDVPTLKELGIDMVITNWNGLYVPFATPQPIVDKLSTELRHVVMNTDANDKLKKLVTETPCTVVMVKERES